MVKVRKEHFVVSKAIPATYNENVIVYQTLNVGHKVTSFP